MGKWVHSLLKKVTKNRTQSENYHQTANRSETNSNVIICGSCGQKLRLPDLSEDLVIKCPKCLARTPLDRRKPDTRSRGPTDYATSAASPTGTRKAGKRRFRDKIMEWIGFLLFLGVILGVGYGLVFLIAFGLNSFFKLPGVAAWAKAHESDLKIFFKLLWLFGRKH